MPGSERAGLTSSPARGRLGITYDDLKHLNERLIYASFTGYGETGPYAN